MGRVSNFDHVFARLRSLSSDEERLADWVCARPDDLRLAFEPHGSIVMWVETFIDGMILAAPIDMPKTWMERDEWSVLEEECRARLAVQIEYQDAR